MQPEQLETAWKDRRRKELFDMGDTVTKIKDFFSASRDPGGGNQVGEADRRGPGRGLAGQGE